MAAKTWKIDTTHSSISFAVRHMMFAKVRGRFATWSGELFLDEDEPARSRVEVSIDAASIDTGVADRDNHLRSADFLDVEHMPSLRFESTSIEERGGDRYRVRGELTIRDVTREVELDVVSGGQAVDPWGKLRAAYTATTSLSRSDFGLTWNQVLEAGGVLVGDRIDVEIEVQAVQAQAVQAA